MHYSLVDDDFKKVINEIILNNGRASSLHRLLRVWEGDTVGILTAVLDEALINYKPIASNISCLGFCFGDLQLIITLEDVLYLTGLPIIGNPVVTDDTYLPEGFRELFGAECSKKLKIGQMFKIINDKNREIDSRIRALLAVIIYCYITPESNGHDIDGTYIPFIRNLDEVNSYAWGAALLACLYSGLCKCYNKNKKTLDGNGWIALGFLLLHIPPLSSALGIEVKVEPPKHLLTSIMEACKPISNNMRSLGRKAREVFENLVDEDIVWQPYAKVMLMEEMHPQLDYVTLCSPLFCISEVFYHAPYLVPKQFAGKDLSGMQKFSHKIRIREKKGCNPINYSKHYRISLKIWDTGIAKLRDTIEQERERAEASGGARHEQPPSGSRSNTALVEFGYVQENLPVVRDQQANIPVVRDQQANIPVVRDQQANIPEHELPPTS